MKIKIVGLVIIFLVSSSSLLIAQSKMGSIEGIVIDRATNEVMPYTNVYLEGTTNGTITDSKGFYRIKQVVPGTYQLKASYVGYQDASYNVLVSADNVTTQDVEISFESIQGEEAVITAQALGQVKAINTQLAAKTIKNVVSEQKIRELPDANAAEALARLPGVSISREGGEAVGIKIRGVDANAVYVNGMRMDAGLGSITSSLIGGIEVSKAFMPDQDADILGGSVDLKMREAPSGFKKDLWLRTGHNNFTKSFKVQDASLLLSNRFFKDKLGIMLSGSWDRKNRGRDVYYVGYQSVGSSANSEELLPVKLTGVTLQHYENLNNRYGLTMFTDYKFKNGKVFYQGFLSSLISDNQYATNNYGSGSDINYESRKYEASERNLMNGIGGEHSIFGVKVDWGISSSNKVSESPDNLFYNAINRHGMSNTSLITDTTYTTPIELMSLGKHQIIYTDAAYIYKTEDKISTDELATRLNIEVPFIISKKIDGYIKFGFKYRGIKRDSHHDGLDGSFRRDSNKPLLNFAISELPDFGWTFDPLDNWLGHKAFSGDYNKSDAEADLGQDFSMLGAKIYYFPDFDRVEQVRKAVANEMSPTLYHKSQNFNSDEQLLAYYIMTEINIGSMLTFTPGVRYEKNTYETSAYWFQEIIRYGPLGTQGELRDTTAGSFNEHFFPMINLKIKPFKWFDIRLAYTETISRPGFNSMSPRFYQDPVFNRDYGDFNLKPQTNTNYDIYLSFYNNKFGLFTVGGFYKEMQNQVLGYSEIIIDPENRVPPVSTSYKNKTFSYPLNNPWPGYVKGLEFDWQVQFAYLPKPFNGIILNANLTLMDSETKYPFYAWTKKELDPFVFPFYKTEGGMTFRKSKIVGTPELIANISLGYEIGGFSGRISSYYQGATLTQAKPSNLTTDVAQSKLLRFDMQLSQKIKKVKGFCFYLNINNLTNNPDRRVLRFYQDRIVSDERYGVSGDLGVRYQF